MWPKFRALSINALLVIVGARCASAQELHSHPHEHAIPEIIITADPLGDVDGHFAAPVSVMDQEELRRSSTRSIGETVSKQLGVTSSDFGNAVGRPVIRGLGGARVRVLEGGIGTMDLSSISADHGVSVESLFAKQVEILRGPATLLYGSGASGGLVNVDNGRILKSVPEKTTAELYGHWDSVAEGWLGGAKLDLPIGHSLALHFDGLVRDTDAIGIPGFGNRTPDEEDRKGILVNSDGESHNVSGGLSWVGEHHHIGFNVSRLDNEYGAPIAHGHGHEEDEEQQDGGTRVDIRQTRVDIDAKYHLDRLMIETARVRWGFNDYEHEEIEGSGEIGTRFNNQEWEGRLEFVLQPMGRWDGVIGFQFRDRDYSAIGEEAFVPPAALDTQALFIFEKADFDNLHIDLGLRLETQAAEPSGLKKRSSHNLISVSGGGTWTYTLGFDLGLSVSRSQRAPTIEELFSNGPHLATDSFEIGDASLGEETSTNVDIFWRKTDGRIRFDLNAFYNHIGDFIFLAANDRNRDGVADRVEDEFGDTGEIVDEDDALLLLNQSQQNARFFGFEFAVETTLFDDARGLLDLRVWSDYVNGELTSNGENIPRLPPLRFGVGLEWSRDAVYAGFDAIRVSGQDKNGPLESETSGYTMVNIHVGYRLPLENFGSMTIFARGTNLADETARRHTSFIKDRAPLPGASGLVGVRLEF